MLSFKTPVATSAALVAALGLLIAPPASAAETNTQRLTSVSTDQSAAVTATVTAPIDSPITFQRPVVSSVAASAPAPVVAAQAPAAAAQGPAQAAQPAPATDSVAPVRQAATSQATAAPAATAYAAPAAATAAVPAAAPAPAPAPAAPAHGSGLSATIAAAALAQLGVHQDCTALVEKSLQAAGIPAAVGAYSPLGLTQFGTPTSNPVPGDIVYYANGGMGEPHVAIYIGNGMAVHGGWNGGDTVVFSVNVGTGHSFFHVG